MKDVKLCIAALTGTPYLSKVDKKGCMTDKRRPLEREEILKAKKLDGVYRKKTKNVVTLETKTLIDLHKDHPTMVGEEDIIKHSG